MILRLASTSSRNSYRWMNNNATTQSSFHKCGLSSVGSARSASSAAMEYHHQSAITEQRHLMLILGKPGGGKGTICGKILNDFSCFQHLSTGDVLRENVRNQTELGIQAKQHMDAGCLVPDELMIRLVLDQCTSSDNQSSSLLLDGFPRTQEQAIALDESLNVDLVINLDIPTETIVERIAERWIHPGSGRVYNCSYNPPKVMGKDDITGEDLIQRVDDQPATVRKRLEKYEKVTAPLVEYYEKKGVLQTFQGTMSDVIYPELKVWLEQELLRLNEQKHEE